MKIKKIVPPKPTKSAPLRHADYWMDPNVDSMDISQLASVQRAIVNFTRIIAKKAVPTTYSTGRDSYTDGKTIVLSAPKSFKDIDSTVGLALHEASHILYTDFDFNYITNVVTDYRAFSAQSGINLPQEFNAFNLKRIVNVIEDRRIDRLVCEAAPGYAGYYTAMYNRYFNDKVIDQALLSNQCVEPNYNNYEFQLINCTNQYFNPGAMPGLEAIMQLIDLPSITRLTSTKEVVDLSVAVLKSICDEIQEQPKVSELTPPPVSDSKSQCDVDEDNLDLSSNAESTMSEGNEGNEGNEGDEGDDIEEANEANEGNEGNDIEEGNEANDIEEGNEANDIEEGNEESENETNGQAPPNSESQEEASEDDANTASGTPASTSNDKLEAKLHNAMKQQKDFLDGVIRKNRVTKEAARVLDNLAKGIVEEVTVKVPDASFTLRDIKCMIVKGLSQAVKVPEIRCHISQSKYHMDLMRPHIIQGLQIGQQLGNRLKTRTESHSLTTTRQASGRIDKRLLSELGFNNDHVFTQTKFEQTRPGHIHISVDASGSMSGTKFYSAIKTAVATAKAASMIDDVTCMITLRGTYTSLSKRNNVLPCMFIVYDSTKDILNSAFAEKLCWLSDGGGTAEHICYDAVLSMIESSSKDRDSFLINISDGEPCWSDQNLNYFGDVARRHAKTVMQKISAAGVSVSSYFVYDSEYELNRNKPMFTALYGKSADFIDVGSLSQLSSSINRLLEYNQK